MGRSALDYDSWILTLMKGRKGRDHEKDADEVFLRKIRRLQIKQRGSRAVIQDVYDASIVKHKKRDLVSSSIMETDDLLGGEWKGEERGSIPNQQPWNRGGPHWSPHPDGCTWRSIAYVQ